MEEKFKIAGIDIVFHMPDGYIRKDLGYLAPFETTQAENPHHFWVTLVNRVDAPQGRLGKSEPGLEIYQDGQWEYRYRGSTVNCASSAYVRTAHKGREHFVQLRNEYSGWLGDKMMMEAMSLDHLAAQENGIILHASFIEYQGRAYLFTAPSGTGKSTQANLWVNLRGAELINGDRVCIRAMDGGLFACGIPFAGSSNVSKNRILPLAAVIYLKQAPQTMISRLRGFQAFRRIWEGCALNPSNESDMAKASGVVQKIVEQVPVCMLACTPDESAVRALEEMLRE